MQSVRVVCGQLVGVWGCVWDRGPALLGCQMHTVHASAAATLLGVQGLDAACGVRIGCCVRLMKPGQRQR